MRISDWSSDVCSSDLLAVGAAVDDVGRAVGHAVRMFAVAATRRHVPMREGLARLAVEPRKPLMAVGARLFAIVAADAQILVDQPRVGRLAQPLARKRFA